MRTSPSVKPLWFAEGTYFAWRDGFGSLKEGFIGERCKCGVAYPGRRFALPWARLCKPVGLSPPKPLIYCDDADSECGRR